MTNTVKKTNNREMEHKSLFDNNPKVLMILNGFTALCWMFCTALDLYSLVTYNKPGGVNLYLCGGLSLFYLGLTLGYVIKYAKSKKNK